MKKADTNNIGLVVLGMHRSGTSCLAGMLQRAGFFADLVEEWSPDNNKGSRENSAIVQLNDSLLSQVGGSWQKPAFSPAPSRKHIQRRNEILQELRSGQRPWMFKDPRTLLTLPFWLEAIPEARMIGIFRHPMAVANSLMVRNSLSIPDGLRLWQAYNQKLLEVVELEKIPLLFFSNDLNGMAEAAEKALVEYFSEQVSKGDLHPEQMQEFISEDLVHQTQPLAVELSDILEKAGLAKGESEKIAQLWKSLLGQARNPLSTLLESTTGNTPPGNQEAGPIERDTIVAEIPDQLTVDASLHEIENALSINPERSDLWRQGVELIKHDDSAKQLSDWVSAGLEHVPDNPLLLCEQAKIIWQTGDHEKAIETMERARSHAPGWPPALNLLSKWYYSREDWQKAASVLNELSVRSHLEPADLKFAQLFINSGKGLSEEESIRLPITVNNNPQEHEFDLTAYKQISALRFDPINDYAVVRLHDIKIYDARNEELDFKRTGSNAQYVKDNDYYFNVIDTQIELQVSETSGHLPCKLIAKVQYLHTGTTAVLECFKIAKQQIEHLRPSGQDTPPKPLGEITDETKSFLAAWKLENIDPTGGKTNETLLNGWIIPKGNGRLNVALRYDGLTRSYSLNVNRPDLIGLLSEVSVEKMEHLNFGFQYAVPKSSTVKIGIEHEMRIYWVDTVLT